ncbi:MAG: tRNA (N6-threonylcarbamoyladenosine(37)-N6)-methyltransferase TrmO [Syntrophobacteria bacterium]
MQPIGRVARQGNEVWLEISKELEPALRGLDEFSHIWLFYWFDRNDVPARRATLQVHPRRDPMIPLHGVFATRAPVRPNLIGLSLCRILSLRGTRIQVDSTDALSGSPILDIKPYLPQSDTSPEAAVPEWIHRPPPKQSWKSWESG